MSVSELMQVALSARMRVQMPGSGLLTRGPWQVFVTQVYIHLVYVGGWGAGQLTWQAWHLPRPWRFAACRAWQDGLGIVGSM